MKNKFIGIVCFIYSTIIIYFWITDKLKLFLVPSMQIYIKVSVFVLIIIGLVFIFNKTHYKFKFTDLVLLLPLIMLFTCSDGILTTSLAKNKIGRMNNNKKIVKQEKIEKIEKEEKEEYDFSNPYFDITDDVYADVSGYLSSSSKANKFIGKTIKVRGFALKYESFLPDGYFALGKYVITCCAADSSFTGFVFKYESYKIKDNHWYEIEGVLKETVDKDGYSMIYVDVKNIKEINDKDEEVYVYPCYSYDETCSKVKKYDLSFN